MNLQVKSADLPPFKPLPQKPPSVETTRKPDGTIYIKQSYSLGQMHRSIAHLLEERASQHPDAQLHRRAHAASRRQAGRLALHHLWRNECARLGRRAIAARSRARARHAADGALGQFDSACRDDAGRDEGARASRARVGRLFADVRRPQQAASRVRDGEAEDDLRGAGTNVCASAGGATAGRR